FGLWAPGHHAVNLALHVLVCSLLYLLCLRLSRSVPFSLAAALLFAVHPFHVESVAWLSSRKDLLAGVFYLLGLLAWNAHRRAETPRGRALGGAAAFACFVLACTSKYTAVTLPAALLLHDWFLFRPRPARLRDRILGPLLRAAPFFLFAALFSKLVVMRFASKGLVRAWYGDSAAATVLTVFQVMREYLVALFVPSKLQACLDHPLTRSLDASSAASALLVLAVLGGGLWALVRAWVRDGDTPAGERLAGFSALFFFAAIAPVSNLPIPMGTLYAERYLYLPLAGGPLLLAALFARALRRREAAPPAAEDGSAQSSDPAIPRPPIPDSPFPISHSPVPHSGAPWGALAAFLGLAAVLSIWGAKSFDRCGAWRDSRTLWGDVLEKSGGVHHTAHFNLGIDATQRATQAGPSGARPLLEEAEAHLRRALVARHESYFYDFARVHAALGTVLSVGGRLDDAVREFDLALEINARSLEAADAPHLREGERLARADILVNRGDARSKRGGAESYRGALEDFRAALELNPDSALAHLNLGLLLARGAEGRGSLETGPPPGLEHIERAAALDPFLAEAPLNLGIVAFQRGELETARAWFEEALARAPDLPDPHFYLAAVHLQKNRPAQAREEFERILGNRRAPPEWKSRAWAQVAGTFEMEGKWEEAEGTYRRALEGLAGEPAAVRKPLQEGLSGLYARFGESRLGQEQFESACRLFEQATAADPENRGAADGLARACVGLGNELAASALALDGRGRREEAVPLYRRAVAAFRRAAELKPSFEAWLAAGETAKRVADLDTVLEAFEKALAFRDVGVLRTEIMKIRLASAEALLREGKAEAAAEECRKAAQADPESPDPWRVLAHAAEKAAKDREAAADKARAEGREADARGHEAAAREALERSLASVREIVARKPGSSADLSQLGRLQAQTGKLEAAEATFRRLVEVEPKAAEHYVNLALILQKRERESEAVEVLRKAVQVNPDSSRAQEALRHTLRQTGLWGLGRWRTQMQEADAVSESADPEGFRKAFERALETARLAEDRLKEYLSRLPGGEQDAPTEKLLRRSAAERLFLEAARRAESDPPGAEERLREALRNEPYHTGALRALAELLERRGATEEAWRALRDFFLVNRDVEESEALRSWMESMGRQVADRRAKAADEKGRRGDLEGAAADLEVATQAFPAFGPYHAARGAVLAKAGRDAEALACFRRAAAQASGAKGPDGRLGAADAALLLAASRQAAALLEKGARPGDAADELAKAAAALPDDPWLALDLAQAQEKAGRRAEAREAFARAKALLEALAPGGEADEARRAYALRQAKEGMERLKE
ncbi:MAG: tetratricopeptide repeat protein, partial [Planctomycetes bacterium]|nr:tetratricopeptide repeat protein [Planctomycetota bacterium]